MQFLQLGSKVKFRANERQAYERGTIVGQAFMQPYLSQPYPIYLVELERGFYRPNNCNPAPFFVSTIPVSCDCVEADA